MNQAFRRTGRRPADLVIVNAKIFTSNARQPMENEIGTLEVGKYADLVIFNTDLREMSTPWFILTHKIELGALDDFVDVTMLAGQPVYVKKGVLLDFPRKKDDREHTYQ